MSKKNDKWLRAGNFLYGREKNSKGEFIVIKDLQGLWVIRYGENYGIYSVLLKTMLDNDIDNLITFATMLYSMTAYVHSTDFYKGVLGLIDKEVKSISGEVDEEEDKKILEDIEAIESIPDLIDNE